MCGWIAARSNHRLMDERDRYRWSYPADPPPPPSQLPPWPTHVAPPPYPIYGIQQGHRPNAPLQRSQPLYRPQYPPAPSQYATRTPSYLAMLPTGHSAQDATATAFQSHQTILSAVESARWLASSDQLAPPAIASRELPPLGPQTAIAGPSRGRGWSEGSTPSYEGVGSAGASTAAPPNTMAVEDDDDPEAPITVKPFIEKLYYLLSRPHEYQDVILWNHDGDAFFVAHNDRFIHEVLPAQFSHANIHSFTPDPPALVLTWKGQLNVYNFQRMTVRQLRHALDVASAAASDFSGWSHPLFRRGDTSTLQLLTPRPSRARLIKKLEKQSRAPGGSEGGGGGAGGGSGVVAQGRGGATSGATGLGSIGEYG
ncbi:hypothetical protein JCM1841_000833 [Sporobolomyces salmonicolor]